MRTARRKAPQVKAMPTAPRMWTTISTRTPFAWFAMRSRVYFHIAAPLAYWLRSSRPVDRHHGKGRHRRPARRHQAARSPQEPQLDARIRPVGGVNAPSLPVTQSAAYNVLTRHVSSALACWRRCISLTGHLKHHIRRGSSYAGWAHDDVSPAHLSHGSGASQRCFRARPPGRAPGLAQSFATDWFSSILLLPVIADSVQD